MISRKFSRRTAAAAVLIFGIYVSAFPQQDSIYRLPPGTRITLKLDVELSSKFAGRGDTFIASVAQPVKIRDVVVVPAGTTVEGRVTDSTQAGLGGKSGKLDLAFGTLRFSKESFREMDASLVKGLVPESSGAFVPLVLISSVGSGAAAGGITGSGRNILIGSAIGAGIGAVIAASRRGRDVKIGKGVEFDIELRKEVVLPVLDY